MARSSHKKSYKSHKRSVKKSRSKTAKRSVKKSRSKTAKRSGKKRGSRKQRVKSHYRMRGMGTMLSMFGGAAGEIEAEYQTKRQTFLDADKVYKDPNSNVPREVSRKEMIVAKTSMDQAKEKMNALLKGISEAARRAAKSLSDNAKTMGAKLSSGLKSLGSRLSSGLKSAVSSVKSEGKKLSTWQKESNKYASKSSVSASDSSSDVSSSVSSNTSSS